MTYDLPQRLSRIADTDIVSADTEAFLAAVSITEQARTLVWHEAQSTAFQIRTLADAMCDPEDAEELYGALASLWLELRLQWQRHNDVANYDLMRHGEAKPIDLVRGSVSSYYFERIESLLQPDQIMCLNQKALALIDSLRQDVASAAEKA
ncbi:hypothetical protein SAMN05421778_102215 [Sphaerotilus natans]|uniref:hypothetical protein n=1 Tax=Sphaerotilus natans TaxID=34103 RepID=UPI00056199AD|nr:hypothetical protein [Sphaerotilus natans]SIQ27401.1 hypothetical protein SAMN05421778_102215 [Sphaerotilus natans]